MTPRAGLAAALVCGLVFAVTAATYGETASSAGWRLDIQDAEWVDGDPAAFLADLVVTQVGTGPARDVRLWIRYPRELFELTDLHPPRDEWLPFLGGQSIARWEPGQARRFTFVLRFSRENAARVAALLGQTEVRLEWREDGHRRALVLPLPAIPAPPARSTTKLRA